MYRIHMNQSSVALTKLVKIPMPKVTEICYEFWEAEPYSWEGKQNLPLNVILNDFVRRT
jgi:hypothetical protein